MSEARLSASAFENAALEELQNTHPYFKCALLGFDGTGKSRTLIELATGLAKALSADRLFLFQNESAGADAAPIIQRENLRCFTMESCSLVDLCEFLDLCQTKAGQGEKVVACIDSLSVVWTDFLAAAKAKLGRALEVGDRVALNEAWRTHFVSRLATARYHLIYTARAGFGYEDEVDEESGRHIQHRDGIHARLEAQSGHEVVLSALMLREERVSGPVRVANIVKDRSGLIDGKRFANPTYQDFAPAVEFRLANAVKPSLRVPKDAGELFETGRDRRIRKEQRTVLVEKIAAEFRRRALSKVDTDALRGRIFGTTSQTEMEGLEPEILEVKLGALLRGSEVSTGLGGGGPFSGRSGGVPSAGPPLPGIAPWADGPMAENKASGGASPPGGPSPGEPESGPSAPPPATQSINSSEPGRPAGATDAAAVARGGALSPPRSVPPCPNKTDEIAAYKPSLTRPCQACKKREATETRFDGLFVCAWCIFPPVESEESPVTGKASSAGSQGPEGVLAPSPACEPAEGRKLLGGAAQTVPGTRANRDEGLAGGGESASKPGDVADGSPKPKRLRCKHVIDREGLTCTLCGKRPRRRAPKLTDEDGIDGPFNKAMKEMPPGFGAGSDAVAEAVSKLPPTPSGNGWDGQ